VNMVLGKTSLNLEAPFTCDVTAPTAYMVVKRAPNIEALRAARREERARARKREEEEREVTYKVLKAGSGTWKTWKQVTERVEGGMTREDMLMKRASQKTDRHCR